MSEKKSGCLKTFEQKIRSPKTLQKNIRKPNNLWAKNNEAKGASK